MERYAADHDNIPGCRTAAGQVPEEISERSPGQLYLQNAAEKNITLNAKKADGSERIKAGDEITLFFSEETLDRFHGNADASGTAQSRLAAEAREAYESIGKLQILYEDRHILLVNKPAGILSQKAHPSDLSLNEWLIGYLLTERKTGESTLDTFRPSVCNRLDRNTSGIVICGKSLYGSQQMSRLLKERSLHKYYLLYVEGQMREGKRTEGFLRKDRMSNKVEILDTQQPGSERIVTSYRPIEIGETETLVEVELITGKPHQIRAHLASMGFPLVGDYKYGNRARNDSRKRQYGIEHQLLHAWRIVLPALNGELESLSGREFRAPVPELFYKLQEAKCISRQTVKG